MMMPIGPYTEWPISRPFNAPWLPNHWMNEIAASIDGARIGVSAISRNTPRPGMQLRVSAYANVNASGTVISVTTLATHTVFHADSSNDGDCRYSRNCASPTNVPSLSWTLLTRIEASGASRNSTSAAHAANSSAWASRCCGSVIARMRPALAASGGAMVAIVERDAVRRSRPDRRVSQQPHAIARQPDRQRSADGERHPVETVPRQVDDDRLQRRCGERHGDEAERAEELDLLHAGRGDVGVVARM